ncbi:hypothetical protein MNV49_000665 [Pseudohyphozyma bogoriensis]|nr:hypothetical protein MNV49_000665 [Pseudohyphozyma bogoriensis]
MVPGETAAPDTPRRPLLRRASLTFGDTRTSELDEQPDDEQVDLKSLERICAGSIKRCSESEVTINKLTHEIDGLLSHWNSSLATLSSLESRAKTLTDQIGASLHLLRNDTSLNLLGTKDGVDQVDERVVRSRRTLKGVRETIAEADTAIEAIEKRMVKEEETLEQISTITQLMLFH